MGNHDHNCRQEPEGLHDADDDEGIGPDGMGEHGEKSGQKARGNTSVERIIGITSPGLAGVPVNGNQQCREKKESYEPGLCQHTGILGIYERITGDAVTEKRLLYEIPCQHVLPGGQAGGGGSINTHAADRQLALFDRLIEGKQDPFLHS